MLLLAGEHALTAQEVRNSLLSLTSSSQFKELVGGIFDLWGMKGRTSQVTSSGNEV